MDGLDDLGRIRHQLSVEEKRAERLDSELAEAAAIGRLLLSRNEELQQEVEYWRSESEQHESRSPHYDREVADWKRALQRLGGDRSGLDDAGCCGTLRRESCHDEERIHSRCRGSPSMDLGWGDSLELRGLHSSIHRDQDCDSDSERFEHLGGRLSSRDARKGSVVDLATEYESDLQELLAENRRLSTRAQYLERDNKTLQEKLEEASASVAEPDCEVSTMASSGGPSSSCLDRRDTLKSGDSRSALDFAEFEGREDRLKTELDTERDRCWELEEQLRETKKCCTELQDQVNMLLGECQDQHSICRAKDAEISGLHEKLADLQQQAQVRAWAMQPSPQPPELSDADVHRFPRLSSLGHDLLMATSPDQLGSTGGSLTGSGGSSKPAAALRMTQEVDELRNQLRAVEASSLREGRSLRAELTLQRREADLLREQLQTALAARNNSEGLAAGSMGSSGGGSGKSVEFSASLAASKAAAHEALMAVEELQTEKERLAKALRTSEQNEQEARDATDRQKSLGKRARLAARKEMEELRQELLKAEEQVYKNEATSSKNSQRDLLGKIDQLKGALQAETKARRYIEAELLRTLAGIRHMDIEIHGC